MVHVSRRCKLEMLSQSKAKRGQVSCVAWQSPSLWLPCSEHLCSSSMGDEPRLLCIRLLVFCRLHSNIWLCWGHISGSQKNVITSELRDGEIARPVKTPDWQYLEEVGSTEALFWCKALLAKRKSAAQ